MASPDPKILIQPVFHPMQKLHTSKLLLHTQANSSFSIFPDTLAEPSAPPEELVSTLPSAPLVPTVPPHGCCVTMHTDLVPAPSFIAMAIVLVFERRCTNIAALLHFTYGKEFSPAVQQVIAAVDQETTWVPSNLLNR